MNHLSRTIRIVAASSLAISGVISALIACSSDDTVSTPTDGGNDAAPDNSQDVVNPPPPPGDAGNDVIVVEAGTLGEFIAQEGDVACTRVRECCTAGIDAGFDMAKCKADLIKVGWDQSLNDVTKPGVLDSGLLVFDQSVASDCLTSLRNLTCVDAPAAEWKNIWQKCYQAIHGSVVVGSPCMGSVECVSTAFCDPDGGSCRGILAASAKCGSTEQCSYRGVGAAQCVLGDAAVPSCQPGLPNGSDCSYDFDCQSGSCNGQDDAGTIYKCDTKADFLGYTCSSYTDGG